MRKIKFWDTWNGSPVKLTVKENEPLDLAKHWGHEEGWSSIGATYRYYPEKQIVIVEVVNDGVDCDGRITHFATYKCDVDRLQWGIQYNETMLPEWIREDSSVYDANAQHANY